MKFVELTRKGTGYKELINVDSINAIEQSEGKTIIYIEGYSFVVEELYETVKAIIADCVEERK